MPSNLFFILIFTLILLIIIFACDRFFFPVSSFDIWFVGDWVSWFFHWSCFKSNDTGHEFWRVDTVRDFIFFLHFFLCFYHTSFFKKDWFCGYPNFVFVLVYSDLMTYAMSFASLFLIEVFFKCFVLYLIFEEFLFIFVQIRFI